MGGSTEQSIIYPMASELLTVRVPPYIVQFLLQLASKTNRTKTDVVVTLLESSPEFKEFQQEQGIPEREPTVPEQLAFIQRQLQALQEASNPFPDSYILQTVEDGLKAILEKADNKQSGYKTNSFSTGLADIRSLVNLLEQRHN